MRKRYLHDIQTWLIFLLAVIAIVSSFYFMMGRTARVFEEPMKSAITGWDGSFHYFWLRSVLVDGDVDFRNDLEYCNTMPVEVKENARKLELTKTGLMPNKYPLGWAVLSVPWFYIGDLLTIVANTFGRSLERDGYSLYYQLSITFGHYLYSFLSLYISFLILRRFFNRKVSILAILLVWLASALYYYQVGQPNMTHHLTYLLVVTGYYLTFKLKDNPERLICWAALGFCAGLLVITRYQAVVYLLFPVIIVIKLLRINKVAYITGFVTLFLAAFIAIFPQLLAWKLLYGEWIVYTYNGETFNWLAPGIGKVLFSPFHGWFYWHPVMLLGMTGLIVFSVRQKKLEYFFWIVIVFLMIYINASWHAWWFGASFGARAFGGCTIFVMIGIAQLLTSAKEKVYLRNLLLLVLSFLVIWNMNLLYLFKYQDKTKIRMNKPLTYKEIVTKSISFYKWRFASEEKRRERNDQFNYH
ncbi:MAG: glycosyltransferase family 39 protein [Bacteroidetes bacterium]|nr:glycosyltransferase family 39 protein [Bacteroidota bacterium]